MDRKKLVKILLSLIFLILVFHSLGNKLYWYSAIWYFDMIMHFLGGLWIALLGFYLFLSKNQSFRLSSEPKALAGAIIKILLFVLLVGVGWEVFEISVNDVLARNPFNALDTFSDIFFDLSGGTLATLYFFKRIMLQ